MIVYLETLILYTVLFLAGGGFIPAAPAVPAAFSAAALIAQILLYIIPSIVLIWYLLIKADPLRFLDTRLRISDLIPMLITLPCLFIIGFSISFSSKHIDGSSAQIALNTPPDTAGWIILGLFCISSAYLEETFFRYYILSRHEELKMTGASALVLSTALFSICHIYEGPWGFLNSLLSGAMLSFLFLRYRSLHGIAIAHGLYNITVYIVNAMTTS